MTVTSTMEQETVLNDSVATAPVAPPRIDRCGPKPTGGGGCGGQLLLKCDEPAVISVEVSGQPVPDVHWHVAGRRVRRTERYRAAASGRRHTLTVLRVTDELEKGVWVMASNVAGEDSCLITVRTYRGTTKSGLRPDWNVQVALTDRFASHLIRTELDMIQCPD